MKAGPVTVRQLLENRQRFCVPIYQRHYVWTRDKQWEPFWNDVRSKAIERLSGRERRFSHFMGAVVLESRGSVSSRQVTSFQVVDDQQRLTTFQLYLAAARDYAKNHGFDDTVGLIEGYLFNEKEHLMEEPEVERFKVWPTKYDRELFQDIITLGRSSLRKKYKEHFYKNQDYIYNYRTVPKLLGAYGYFYDRIRLAVETDDLEDDFAESVEEEISDDPDSASLAEESPTTDRADREIRLDALWEALIEEFKVVEITLEEGDDAQVIFETLNERGEPLLAADLVRNNIFHRADARRENAEKLFERHWKDFEDPFWSEQEKQGRYKRERIEFFLANFVAGKVADEVSLSKLFSEYKAFLKIQASKPGGGYPSVDAELADLASFGALYRQILERSEDNPLGRFSRRLHPWDVTTVYPLVLRLWAEEAVEESDRLDSLEILLSFIVRRAICGLTTKNYNKFFLAVLRHLEKNDFRSTTLSAYLTAQTSESARFPKDHEFESAWLSAPIYKRLNSPKIKAVLETIERRKRHRFHETDQLKSDLTVEHIMPSEWEKHWPLPDGTKPTDDDLFQATLIRKEDESRIGKIIRRNRLKDSFGNLTILTQPLNSRVRNGPFRDKRIELQDHSLLVLNREITQSESWSEAKIQQRSESLFEDAVSIWSYPATDTTQQSESAP